MKAFAEDRLKPTQQRRVLQLDGQRTTAINNLPPHSNIVPVIIWDISYVYDIKFPSLTFLFIWLLRRGLSHTQKYCLAALATDHFVAMDHWTQTDKAYTENPFSGRPLTRQLFSPLASLTPKTERYSITLLPSVTALDGVRDPGNKRSEIMQLISKMINEYLRTLGFLSEKNFLSRVFERF